MSSDWSSSPRGQAPNHEYETVADLWLSNRSGTFSSMRKGTQTRRKNEKRESVAQLASLTESSPKKLREKSSWLGMSRGYATTPSGEGQWVRVRCTLTDEGRECRLTIVGDKGTLQHSLNIKILRATDIRFADRSLFFRTDCLSIHAPAIAFMAHSPSLQTLVPNTSDCVCGHHGHRRQPPGGLILDPIYLAFESKDAVNCWNALLRSYAKPEIYGNNVDPRGLYRMWRQVQLTVMHGRNLGVFGRAVSTDMVTSTTPLSEAERGDNAGEASTDSSVYCEAFIDGLASGRTTMQKGQAGTGSDSPSWTWLESFTISDLPPFGILSIRVWRVKKSTKTFLVGTVDITLANFRRGQFVEGWFPVMTCGSNGSSFQVGDLKLKMKVDEEIILPSDAYRAITSTLDKRNCLDLLSELDQKMQLGDISLHMLSLAVGRGTYLTDLLALAEREVNKAPNSNTLFRGNSVFTKSVEQAMSFFGRPFLEASVGPCIHELSAERVELETDPSRNPRGAKDVEQSIRMLPIWCTKFWSQIYSMRDHCPPELRRLFQCIRELVEKRFTSVELKWQSVSAFCFLRLIVPAILHPHLWGLHPGLPSPGMQRSLTLIAKALQSLANLSKEQKESHMQGIAGFLDQNIPAMISYIMQVSSPPTERSHPETSDTYDRLLIMQSLRERREQTRMLAPLTSEAISVLPHLLDIPKHLAVLSSAVVRHARTTPQLATSRHVPLAKESIVEDFALKCFEIEAKAVQSVSRLASTTPSAPTAPRHSRRVHSRPSNNPSQDGPSAEHTKPPRQRLKSGRPHTAPDASSSTSSSTFHTPFPSPPLMSSPTAPLFSRSGKPSDDSGTSSPASPSARFFARRPSADVSKAYREHIPVSATTSHPFPPPDPYTLHRSPSQQLDPNEIDMTEDAVARRRGGFLRSWLSRNAR